MEILSKLWWNGIDRWWMDDEWIIVGPLSMFPKAHITFWALSPIKSTSCSNYGPFCSISGQPHVAYLFYPYILNGILYWPKICWECFHHPYTPPHKTYWPMDARISRKVKHGFRWWRLISRKVGTWNLLKLLEHITIIHVHLHMKNLVQWMHKFRYIIKTILCSMYFGLL